MEKSEKHMSIQGLELVTLIRTVVFKIELKEQLELPDNTVCYVDGISIPHTWRTIASHDNKFNIIFKMGYVSHWWWYRHDSGI